MSEARSLWANIVREDSSKAKEILDIVEKIFGKRMKISEVQPSQVELLAVLIDEIKNYTN